MRRAFLPSYFKLYHLLHGVVVLVAKAYYDYVGMALDDSHTDSSLEKLAECGYQFHQAIVNSLLADLHNQWNFPKHHLLVCHVRHARREMGHPSNCSTAIFEHKHQPFKQDYSIGSNNNKRDQCVRRTELRYL